MAGMLFFGKQSTEYSKVFASPHTALPGLIYYSPLYFQVAAGQTATEAGVSSIPLVMGVVVSNILSGGVASATGWAWPFIPAGAILAAIGAGLISTLNLASGSGEKIGYLFLAGFGCGFTVQMILLVAQGSTKQEHVSTVTANTSFWQGACRGRLHVFRRLLTLFNSSWRRPWDRIPRSHLCESSNRKVDSVLPSGHGDRRLH
jgi:hypothetical protein